MLGCVGRQYWVHNPYCIDALHFTRGVVWSALYGMGSGGAEMNAPLCPSLPLLGSPYQGLSVSRTLSLYYYVLAGDLIGLEVFEQFCLPRVRVECNPTATHSK